MLTRILLIAVLVLLAGRALLRLLGGILEGATPRSRPAAGPPEKGERMVRDPVCGTFVVPSRSLAVREKDGIVYFCSEKCRAAWQAR